MSRRAVVLGGSIAGLLAAAALAGAYAEVIVVERDHLGEEVDSVPRRGIPHGRHAHGLLAGGLLAVEQLVPGFADQLVALGAHDGDAAGHVRFCPNGRRLRQVVSGDRSLAMTRPLLESFLRSRVRSLPEVSWRTGTDIVAPTTSRTGRATRVDGVRVQRPGSPEEHIEADLVVDATGRGSRTPVWLKDMGYPQPAEETVRVELTYTTRTYRMGREDIDNDLAIVVVPTAERPRGGVLLAQEDGIGILTLFGVLGDKAPTDPDGFLEFARSLPRPEIHDLARRLQPLSDATIFAFPASVRRRYERLRRFPDGLLVIGDALCSFNPAYGQGMSVCAREAVVLRDHARSGRSIDARRFNRALARIVDFPWQVVNGGDLSLPGMPGRPTTAMRLLNSYLARLQAAAEHNGELAVAISRVVNLCAAPPTLMRPDRLVRALRV